MSKITEALLNLSSTVDGDDYGKRTLSSVITGDNQNLDLTGRIRTSERDILFTKNTASTSNHVIRESLTGSATATYNFNHSSIDLTCTTASGDKVVRQSFHYTPYLPGTPLLFKGAMSFAASKTNFRQRVGVFDDNDGAFFEDDGTGMGVVVRTNTSGSPVDTRIAQSSWNVDKLDGTGKSGIDLTTGNGFNRQIIYFISHLWHGGGGVQFGILFEQKVILCHKFYTPDAPLPFMSKPNAPYRCEVENTGVTASSTTFKEGSVDIAAEGGHQIRGEDRVVYNGTTAKSVTTSATILLGARLKTTFNGNTCRRILKLLETDVFTKSEDLFVVVELVIEPTSTTGGTWTDKGDPDTAIQYNTGLTAVTGGDRHEIDCYYVPSAGTGVGKAATGKGINRFDDTNSVACQNIAGDTADLFIITAYAISGTSTDARASMKLLEFE